jgi:hypothetical protein
MYSWQHPQADHFTVALVLDPAALPDALAHPRCNAYAGWLVSRVRTGQSTPPKTDPALEQVRQQVLAQLTELGHDIVMPEPIKPTVTRTSRAW